MTTTLTESIQAIEKINAHTITKKSRSNFSSAFIFLSKNKRKAIERVYAFFRIIDDIVDEQENKNLQKEMLTFWKQAIHLTYESKPPIELLKELHESILEFGIPKNYFLDLIAGCEMDIVKRRYATFDELYQYCFKVASIVGLVCMKIFQCEGPQYEKAAINLGVALQLTNIIRDVGTDVKKDRIYIPQDELIRFNVKESDLINGENTPQFKELMNFQYDRAFQFYEKGNLQFELPLKKNLLASHIMGRVYFSLLMKIRSLDYPVLKKRVSLSFTEKSRILSKSFIWYLFQ